MPSRTGATRPGSEGDGTYCPHCTDENGTLQSFDERFERMTQFMVQQGKAATREEAEKQTLAYMATMPAWRNHPKVRAGKSES